MNCKKTWLFHISQRWESNHADKKHVAKTISRDGPPYGGGWELLANWRHVPKTWAADWNLGTTGVSILAIWVHLRVSDLLHKIWHVIPYWKPPISVQRFKMISRNVAGERVSWVTAITGERHQGLGLDGFSLISSQRFRRSAGFQNKLLELGRSSSAKHEVGRMRPFKADVVICI